MSAREIFEEVTAIRNILVPRITSACEKLCL